MDPNKIHIDELVRQRLQDGEEEPRPGAWISMRELLDKQMPTSRPLGGFAWGNATRWTAALVLLTLLAGGYGVMNHRQVSHQGVAENFGKSKNAVISAATTSSASPSVDDNTIPASSEAQAAASRVASGRDAASASRPSAAVTARAFSDASYASATPRRTWAGRHTPPATLAISTSATNSDAASTSDVRAASPRATTTVRGTRRRSGNTADRATVSTSTVENSATASQVAKVEKTDAPATARESRHNTPDARTGNANASARRTRRSRETSGVSSNLAETVSSAVRTESPRNLRSRNTRGGGIKTVNIPDSIKAQVKRDTVQTIRIAHRYMSTRGVRGGRYLVDTMAAAPYIIERPLPVVATTSGASANTSANPSRTRRKIFSRKNSGTPVEGLAAASATPAKAMPGATGDMKKSSTPLLNPAASAQLASAAPGATASEVLVPLSSKMVRSTKSDKMQYSAQEQIQNVMRRTEFLFGQMRLYTGVTSGFNASVGGTSMGGFHAGLVGLLAINDHWSAGIEGKFVQRFNRGKELHDPYFHYSAKTFNNFTDPSGQAYKVYRVTTDSFDHYYKLSTLETVELPVYARYSFHRFHAFGGANLTYGFRVKNIERVDRFAGRETAGMDTVLATTQYAPPANTAASVKLEDFGPRFGLGYTAGIGYQASPAVLVDVRMTQLVWDNRSAGAGGLRVSQMYYRVPSLQLSIGYRFSQRMARP